MKFNRIFYKSDDFVTAIDVYPLSQKLICCGNYSGRIFIYNFDEKQLTVENQLKLQRRKSQTSDTEIIEIPHVSALAFSPNGNHLFCGLENGHLIALDPNILMELKSYNQMQDKIISIKFPKDSNFMTIYVRLL